MLPFNPELIDRFLTLRGKSETLEEVTANLRKAIECHLLSLLRDRLRFPVDKRARKGYAIPVMVRVPRLA